MTDNQTKLLLVPCSGEETTDLAQEIFKILQKDYGMEQQIEILDSIIQHPSNDVEEDYRLICYNLSSEQLDSVGW